MITFRCTQKVRDLLGLGDDDLSEETDGDLHEWFIETATIERYRCLLFTHRVSLYNFWALAVRRPDLLALDELFHHQALLMLKGDGFTDAEIARLFPGAGHRFAKTNSRPVTGSMNNHVQHSRWYFQCDGGIRVSDFPAINRRLKTHPWVLSRQVRPWISRSTS
jgi:hypothetical protein